MRIPHWLRRRLMKLVLSWDDAPLLSGGTLYFSDGTGELRVVDAASEDGKYIYIATRP